MAQQLTLTDRILIAMRSITHVEKAGTSYDRKYSYQKWEDVVLVVRSACLEAGIIILPSISSVENFESNGKTFWRVYADIAITDGKETFRITGAGESNNGTDKAIQAAYSLAVKYALLKVFMIPVANDETDGDAHPQGEAIQPSNEMPRAVITEANSDKMAETEAKRLLKDSGLPIATRKEYAAKCKELNISLNDFFRYVCSIVPHNSNPNAEAMADWVQGFFELFTCADGYMIGKLG
jgi:hypothetical protein